MWQEFVRVTSLRHGSWRRHQAHQANLVLWTFLSGLHCRPLTSEKSWERSCHCGGMGKLAILCLLVQPWHVEMWRISCPPSLINKCGSSSQLLMCHLAAHETGKGQHIRISEAGYHTSILLLVCVSFTIIGQPRNSVLIRRV